MSSCQGTFLRLGRFKLSCYGFLMLKGDYTKEKKKETKLDYLLEKEYTATS